MPRRECCIPGVILSFVSAALLILATVSLPLSWSANTPFSVVNAYDLDPPLLDFTSGSNVNRQVTSLSFGNYGYCSGSSASGEFCNNLGHGYTVILRPAVNVTDAAYGETRINASWTRGLVVVVVAFVFSVLALATAVVPNLLVMLVSSLLHLLTALLTLIAFIIQIVMFVYTRTRIRQVSPNAVVMPGVAFYLTLIALPFLVLAGITVCCGRRDKEPKFSSYEDDERKGGLGGLFKRRGGASSRRGASDGANGSSIPLDSRAKVLNAFEESKA